MIDRRHVIVGAAAVVASIAARPVAALSRGEPLSSLPAALPSGFKRGAVETPRHRTAYIENGPATGPLMIFLHGFPELGIVWKAQMAHFAQAGWRCVAPDMRGYGGSSAPAAVAAYTVREIATDMVELHDALGGTPAIWVGHDWGAPIAWTMASHYPERCRGVIGLSVTYLSRGHALPNLVPLVDRRLYPIDRYPVGQWDYWLYYRESFELARRELEADPAATIATLFRAGDPAAVDQPSPTASLRRNGGWFPPNHRAPMMARDPRLLSQADFDQFVAAFRTTGFRPGIAWYLNDAANIELAGAARNYGRLDLPVLFIHARYDPVDETLRGRLAEPMRQDCADLTEATVASGHFIMLEQPAALCRAIDGWLVKLPALRDVTRAIPSAPPLEPAGKNYD